MSKTTTKPKKGNINNLREQLLGPIKVYLDSGERDEAGNPLMETIEAEDGGDNTERPARETEPFLEEVYARKHYMTPKAEDEFKKLREDEQFSGRPATQIAHMLCKMVAKWDLNVDGEVIELTPEAIVEADVPREILSSILVACQEYGKPPKVLSGS